MAFYQVLYWKDIPAQVKVTEPGKRPISRQLPGRFQEAIDVRAMREGLVGTDDYLEQWHWSQKMERDLPGDELLDTIIRELAPSASE